MGADIREYQPGKGRPEDMKDTFRDVECLVLVPVHSEDMYQATRNVMQAAQEAKVKGMVLWSSLAAGIVSGEHPPGGGGGGGGSGGGSSSGAATRSSGGGSGEEYLKLFTQMHQIEQEVKQVQIPCSCILRVAFPMQGLLALSKVMQNRGIFPLTSRTGKMAPVNVKDVAKVTARMLTGDIKDMGRHHHQLYTLTGMHTHTGPDMTDVLNSRVHARLQFEEVTLEQMRDILDKAGYNHTEGEKVSQKILLGWFDLFHQHKTDIKTAELEQLLGEKPTDMATFFEENADAFRPHRVAVHMVRDSRCDASMMMKSR